jgi:hypothetical protein
MALPKKRSPLADKERITKALETAGKMGQAASPEPSSRKGRAPGKNKVVRNPGKNSGSVGRPPHDEDLKLKAFNLPIPMIDDLARIAEEEYGNNISLLARRIFRDFLEKRKTKKNN